MNIHSHKITINLDILYLFGELPITSLNSFVIVGWLVRSRLINHATQSHVVVPLVVVTVTATVVVAMIVISSDYYFLLFPPLVWQFS